jgi:hypothetical protein
MMKNAAKLNRRAMSQYNKLSPLQKVIFVVGGWTILILSILFLIYSERIFAALLPAAKKWRDVPAGWLILWLLIFFVSFPPLIGYSSLLTISGFVYGFPNGYDTPSPEFATVDVLTSPQMVYSSQRNDSRKHNGFYPLPIITEEYGPPLDRKRQALRRFGSYPET